MSSLIQHLRRAALHGEEDGPSDGQLLECFLAQHDERAFEELVRRHGPMVWGVCRRILRKLQDIEDAFQATFLVLVRKGASIQPREAVGNWLYGVAYRTAQRAGAQKSRRQQKESEAVDRSASQTASDDCWLELLPHLDRELNRLPDKYRLPVVLCDLEGRSRKDVAHHLQIPEGTLSSRLATARKRLADRLRPHGLTLTGGALATLMAQNTASAGVPKALLASTVKAGMLVATGQAAGIVSAVVISLTEGMVKAMLLTKLRTAVVSVLALTILAAGVGVPAYRIWAADESEAAEKTQKKTKPDRASDAVHGSGRVVTKEVKVAGFTSVRVSHAFQVTLLQGPAYHVMITADDNVLPHIKVIKEGKELRIFLDSEKRIVHAETLKAQITMPELRVLKVGGACKVTINGFKQIKEFRVKVGGASTLSGEILADKLFLEVGGASTVELKGKAKIATLSAGGASRLRLAGFAIDQATVTVGGASNATVQVKDKLDYTVGGASRLEYRGKPTLGKHSAHGASSVSAK